MINLRRSELNVQDLTNADIKIAQSKMSPRRITENERHFKIPISGN